MKFKKTVVSMGLSRSNNNIVTLGISDGHSGDKVMDIEMSLKELGLLVTGLHGVKGVADFNEGANIACKREVKTVSCKRVHGGRDDQVKEVAQHFAENYAKIGWQLQSDGTRSKQSGDKHDYVIKRYSPVNDPTKVERYY